MSQKVKVVANPISFQLNGITFGLVNTDVLLNLKKEEWYRKNANASSGEAVEPMTRLGQHLFSQRSYYPLWPVPREHASELSFDCSRAYLTKMPPVQPDILLCPSQLKSFLRIVESSLFVNPGSVCRPASSVPSGGTFVRMSISPMPELIGADPAAIQSSADQIVDNRIQERCRVDLLKIG